MAGISIDLLKDAKKKGKLIEHDEEIKYIRFREDFRSIQRGTVIVQTTLETSGRGTSEPGTRIIRGFPHILRIFSLEKGIQKNMQGDSFHAEEKIDGFNLRVAKINGNLFAFSRGGFIDWFSTEKVRDMGYERLFNDYPEAVLCGEMVGNTPYTPPTSTFDVRLFVFDIDQGDGAYLKPKEKYALLKKYNIDSVPVKIGRAHV